MALLHLRTSDPALAAVIERVGPCSLRPAKKYFHSLVRSILAQQISTAAARSIMAKVTRLTEGRFTPEVFAALSDEELRSAGISPQKLRYLRDLTNHALHGSLRLETIWRLPDAEVIARLTQVTGIGVWTAQMFLMFSLGRLDVFPHADLGIRAALRNLYGLKSLPDEKTALRIGEKWSPYATIGSWYCWRSLEL